MSRPAWEPLPDEDSVLLDYARRLDKFRAGRRAVRLYLSRLRPHNRREQHLRIAASTFDLLLSKFDGALFRLHDSDMVVVCNGASVADIDDCVLRLRYMFGDDPLFQDEDEKGAPGVADPFCTWYDLGKDYPAFLDAAEANIRDALEELAQQEQSRLIEKWAVPTAEDRYTFVLQTMRQYILLRRAVRRGPAATRGTPARSRARPRSRCT